VAITLVLLLFQVKLEDARRLSLYREELRKSVHINKSIIEHLQLDKSILQGTLDEQKIKERISVMIQ
jgi:Mg2+/Co2+ transporter CorB